MAKIPEHYKDRPELVSQVIEARKVQMETEDTEFAIEWLMTEAAMSFQSARRVLQDETFQYVALYPEGHPGLESIRAEQRAKSKRQYEMTKLKPSIIDRDNGRCQNCEKRVQGKNATIDHKDPEGPATLDNLHLLCRACNTVKGKRTWQDFQQEQQRYQALQDARPDVICRETGLSIRGRSWKESGCLKHVFCRQFGKCFSAIDHEHKVEIAAHYANEY